MMSSPDFVNVVLPNGIDPQDEKFDFKSLYKTYKRKAFWGNAEAYYVVGCLLYKGLGVEQDLQAALAHFQKSADSGNKDAAYACAQMYEKGEGCTADMAKAIKYYKIVAPDNGNVANIIGMHYFKGENVPQSDAEAFKYFKMAADAGVSVGAYNTGYMYAKGRGTAKDPSKAVEYFVETILKGRKEDIFELLKMAGVSLDNLSVLNEQAISRLTALAHCYDWGWSGLKRNSEISLRIYPYIAPLDPVAAVQYIQCYRSGIGADRDPVKALQIAQDIVAGKPWNEKYKNVYFIIGDSYYCGSGVEKDYAKALPYLEYAAGYGHSLASYYVGLMYKYGKGTAKNLLKSFGFLKFAAENKESRAEVELAHSYQYGLGCEVDLKQAFHWYKKHFDSCESLSIKDYYSASKLAFMYMNGNGCDKNYDEAFRLAKIAAEGNLDNGYGALAYCYAKGYGTKNDYALALQYCKKALEIAPEYQGMKELLQQLSADNGNSLKPAADLNKIFMKAAGSVVGAIVGGVVEGLLGAGSDD